jgi:hypothetical protein
MEAGSAELLTYCTQATLLEPALAQNYVETLQRSIRSALYAQAVAYENGEPITDVLDVALDAGRRVVNGRTQTKGTSAGCGHRSLVRTFYGGRTRVRHRGSEVASLTTRK